MAIQSYSELKPLWIQDVINSYAIDKHVQELLAQLVLCNTPYYRNPK
jgi:hypothetical protein